MNIRQAKQELINTVKAYTAKDETGAYLIPPEKQRPLLLIGPPGIGKTAIAWQAAQECGIGLVSYTITHHTRQSTIGLPFISDKVYGGTPYKITEYTMSEIIASVYDMIEKTGVKEGILFLDEINCVSETLAPTMLQFLQYKTFGTHHLPDGFIIVTAGNPPQYNKSVRDFDIVTLDRVRKLEIEEDFDAFKEYASANSIHGSVMAYLTLRRDNFYSVRADVEDRYFVTARGWEDLSHLIRVYEKQQIPVTKTVAGQYLQDPVIAEDFASYYALYNKYKNIYRVEDILDGKVSERALEVRNAPFDEKLSLILLLSDALQQIFRGLSQKKAEQTMLLSILSDLRAHLKSGAEPSAAGYIRGEKNRIEETLRSDEKGRLLTEEKKRSLRGVVLALEELENRLLDESENRPADESAAGMSAAESAVGMNADDPAGDFAAASAWFAARENSRQEEIRSADAKLTSAFAFLARAFGEGQEMVIFLSELSAGKWSMEFLTAHPNEAYYRYNKLLLLQERRQELVQDILELM